MFENISSVASQVVILFIIIGVGVILTKFKVLNKERISGLIDIVVYIVTPSNIIVSFQREFKPELIFKLGLSFLAAFTVFFINCVLAKLIIKEKNPEGKIFVEDDCAHYLGLKYENEIRDHGFVCGAGLFIGSILANGDICVCPNVRRKELVQGNIKTDSFVDVWENRFEQFRGKRITTNSKCKKCKSYKYCRGDSFHTWNYDDKKPNMCMKDILCEQFVE